MNESLICLISDAFSIARILPDIFYIEYDCLLSNLI